MMRTVKARPVRFLSATSINPFPYPRRDPVAEQKTERRWTSPTEPHTPPMEPSDEATDDELDLAREQGGVYLNALEHMVDEVADIGAEVRAGDYVVAYAVEEAEGMYELVDGALEWREPDGNLHIELSVRDASDDRFVPGLKMHLTVVDASGGEVGTEEMPFLWHPWLYHYGRNWTIPGSGRYTLRVRIEPPTFMRHDRENGQRFGEEVRVVFEDVELEVAG